jgi:hypothetical protein
MNYQIGCQAGEEIGISTEGIASKLVKDHHALLRIPLTPPPQPSLPNRLPNMAPLQSRAVRCASAAMGQATSIVLRRPSYFVQQRMISLVLLLLSPRRRAQQGSNGQA